MEPRRQLIRLAGAAAPSGMLGTNVSSFAIETRPSRLPFPRFGPDRESGNWASLFAPARKYEFDLTRALVHERDLLLDDDIAEAAQLRCQSLRFGGQRVKFDLRGDNAINRNRKGAAGERRRLLRDQLRDLCLLIHREKIGLRGGGRGWRLRRGCRNNKGQACRQRQNLSHANLFF